MEKWKAHTISYIIYETDVRFLLVLPLWHMIKGGKMDKQDCLWVTLGSCDESGGSSSFPVPEHQVLLQAQPATGPLCSWSQSARVPSWHTAPLNGRCSSLDSF